METALVAGVALVGVGAIVLGIVEAWRNTRYGRAQRTTGVVVGHHVMRGSEPGDVDTYALVVDWRSPDGQPRRFTTRYSSSFPDRVGTELPLEFLPDDPVGTVRAGNWAGRWQGSVVAIVVGLVFLGVAWFMNFTLRMA